MIAASRRFVAPSFLLFFLTLIIIWTVRLLPGSFGWVRVPASEVLDKFKPGPAKPPAILPHVEDFFEQAFSIDKPKTLAYPAIRDYCSHVEFKEDVYVDCIGIFAGLMSVVSQVKTCFKMAIDSGSNLILPTMAPRDNEKLLEYNLLHPEKHVVYDKWFDAEHLREVMGRECPRMKILHPKELNNTVQVAHTFNITCNLAPEFHAFVPLFWVGRPYGPFFDGELDKLQKANPYSPNNGITVAKIDPRFLIYRITDDGSGRDLRLWNDLSNVIRFLKPERQVANHIVDLLRQKGPYYGVHFRTENDTIWSPFENQLKVDLDALDQAWAKYGGPGQKKPVIYLACGDEAQAERFVVAGAERGWEVTHKWKLLENDEAMTNMLKGLKFDFQGAVDLGILVRSQFFFGITGSAFSSSMSNLRDPTGRYRGSSFMVPDDAGARTHLFNDGAAGGYPCCL